MYRSFCDIFIICIFAILLCFNSCTPSTNKTKIDKTTDTSAIYLDYKQISGDLYYDAATNIVYFKNATKDLYNVYIPYIAPNGLPYKYNKTTGDLEEIHIETIIQN